MFSFESNPRWFDRWNSCFTDHFGTIDVIFGEKMSYYVISVFEVLESLLKKLENLPEHSGKETASSTNYINGYRNCVKITFQRIDDLYFDFGIQV